MTQQQDKQLLQAPYVYNKPEETIVAETEYDPTTTDTDIDADCIGKVLKDLYVLADSDCTIQFWDYRTDAYQTNTEKITADIAAIWKDEFIGKHKITPTLGSVTLEVHRGNSLP